MLTSGLALYSLHPPPDYRWKKLCTITPVLRRQWLCHNVHNTVITPCFRTARLVFTLCFIYGLLTYKHSRNLKLYTLNYCKPLILVLEIKLQKMWNTDVSLVTRKLCVTRCSSELVGQNALHIENYNLSQKAIFLIKSITLLQAN